MSPSLLARGELLLTVDSPVWLQELNFYRRDILKKLRFLWCQRDTFQVRKGFCKSEVGSQGAKRQQSRDSPDTEQAFIRETVAEICDEGLKESLKVTMEKAITSGKTKIR